MAPSYPKDPRKKYSIAIAGGGIGGLCCAIGLLHQGVNVSLYESAHHFGEIGAGVALGPNAAKAMSMIDPGIRKAFDACATNNAWDSHKQIWFSFRKGQDKSSHVGTKILDLNCPSGQASVHRARFLDELVKLVPDDIAYFGKRLDDVVERHDDGKLELRFHDGTTAIHDAVIGCDGVKSNTRRVLLGKDHQAAHPTFTGKYAYRGLIPMPEAVSLLGDELARNSQMYLGKGGHILTFPIEHGDTMNVVAFSTKDDGDWGDKEWVLHTDKASMKADFDQDWCDAAHSIIDLMQKPDLWSLWDHQPAPTYFKSRLCILGDAAHASTPHHGAGAGQAIEDALVMSRLFEKVTEVPQIETAFRAFDKVRRPRSQRQVSLARESGLLWDGQLVGVKDDWDKLREMVLHRMDWIWDVDLDAHVKQALDEFEKDG